MLKRLYIQNLATIKNQVVEFNGGFSALTGETGAGKSVLIKALRLILGEKCPKDLIRTNESFLSVEGTFQIDSIPPVLELLQNMDIEHEGDLIIRRKVHVSGKNSIFLNEHSVNLGSLSQFGQLLVDLHGQHSQQILLNSNFHIDFLDAFVGHRNKTEQFTKQYEQLLRKKKSLKDLENSAQDRNREIDFLRFQINEIEQAGFTQEEETALNEEASLLANGEQLISTLTPIAEWNSGEGSPISTIASSIDQLRKAATVDQNLEPLIKEVKSGLIILEEASSEITAYLSKIEINPQKLEDINNRLADLDKLKRKYGNSLEEIESFRLAQSKKLEEAENQEVSFGTLEKEIKQETKSLLIEAEALSQARIEAKLSFETIITDTLKQLGMEQSRFEIQFTPIVQKEEDELPFRGKGIDAIEFLIATNPGTPLKPLTKIASGGEISRIMLAIKTALNFDISFGSMVFDEVDSGISGRVAETVGEKLLQLGQSRQIICITHSPQIAAKALDHFKVEKTIEKNMSETTIHKLSKDDRVDEIAQFMGGNEISDKTRSAAAEMLTPHN